MEPISAAASIFGLLGAAGKVSESLIKFSRGFKEAPKLAQTVVQEVSDVSAVLRQLQKYIVGARANSATNNNLVMVEELVVTLSSCVFIFSELEEIVDSLKPALPMRPARLAQWVYREDAIRKLLVRLQASKSSLNLMVATMTWSVQLGMLSLIQKELTHAYSSESVGEAQASVSQLTKLVTRVLQVRLL